ncbi:MAG TPA: DUF1475 family protein [Terriglobales bacterium]|jgi:hypothetical protein|nr:DUF1475 family protein [Terriglobales bacterium]
MRLLLKLLFSAIFLWMVGMTVYVSFHKPIWLSPSEFSWAGSPWAVATLFDAYFGFVTFFVWVCFKERSLGLKLIWFVLIMALGNIAMSGYVLLQLFRLPANEPISNLLTKRHV